jgi:YggT family protein
MFGDITRFLLDTIFTLFGAALLLRAWTQAVRLSPRNPLSQAIFQLTGWLVHPLRRVIPATGYIDWASLVATYLTALVYLVLLVSTIGISPLGLLPFGFLGAVFIALKWAFNVLVWVTLVSAVLSWVAPHCAHGRSAGCAGRSAAAPHPPRAAAAGRAGSVAAGAAGGGAGGGDCAVARVSAVHVTAKPRAACPGGRRRATP